MAALGSEDSEYFGTVVPTFAVTLCLLLLTVIGIISWLRKRIRPSWWRDKCGCFGGDGGGSMLPPLNNAFPTKSPPPQATFTGIHRSNINAEGFDNPSFYNADNSSATKQESDFRKNNFTSVPKINIERPPPDYYSLDRTSQYKAREGYVDFMSEVGESFRLRANTNESRKMSKVISKPSITSDYVSDVDSEYYLPVARKPTGGRYSSRRLAEKKKHMRKRYARTSTRTHHKKGHKYATTCLTNIGNSNKVELRKPVARRHSVATGNSKHEDSNDRPIPPLRTKRKRSASDAHLLTTSWKSPTKPLGKPDTEKRQERSPFRRAGSVQIRRPLEKQSHSPEKNLTKTNSLKPLPTKSSGLVRSETILELPIYIKPDSRPVSARSGTSEAIRKSYGGARPKTRSKPPRSYISRERKHGRHSDANSKSKEKWEWGYGSLPADFGKIHSMALEQIGMTPEGLADSIENLDFDKLCRPVTTIPDEKRLSTPRKPIISDHMAGEEKELLRNTYKLEEYGIVATDL